MIFWIAKTLCGFTGWDISKVQKRLLLGLMVIGFLAVCIIGGLIFKACHKAPKLDEKAIQKAQQAIAKQDREAMLQVLAESDTKEAQVDSNIKLAEQATKDAKKNYLGLSNDDLAAELERRSKE